MSTRHVAARLHWNDNTIDRNRTLDHRMMAQSSALLLKYKEASRVNNKKLKKKRKRRSLQSLN